MTNHRQPVLTEPNASLLELLALLVDEARACADSLDDTVAAARVRHAIKDIDDVLRAGLTEVSTRSDDHERAFDLAFASRSSVDAVAV